jgi:predicted metal-dependent HD superfamily phosphohydrolase
VDNFKYDRLAQKWQQFCVNISCDRVYDRLVDAYTQPDRYYHNFNHIDCVLRTLDRFKDLQNPRSVYLAAWLHDLVYEPQASDNEAKSAEAAQELLTSLGESIATIDRVQQLILATKGHQIDTGDLDRCIFLDADLAIFGANPVRYQAYQQAIRHEYSWVADTAYQAGRIQVLESFLGRDRLYYTDLLFNELESIARDNIQQEITLLKTKRDRARSIFAKKDRSEELI